MQALTGAIAAYEANELDRCEKLSTDILAADPANALALGLMGLVLLNKGHGDRAIDSLCHSIERGARALPLSIALAQLARNSQCQSERITTSLVISLALPNMTTDGQVLAFYDRVLDALSFNRQGDSIWCRRVFEVIIVPWLKQLTDNESYAAALVLEYKIYDNFVKQTETEDHFQFVYQAITPHLSKIGAAFRENIEPTYKPAQQKSTPTIAFILHAASALAHVQALHQTLTGYRQLENRPWKPVVYCLSGYNETMADWFDDIDIDINFIDNFSQTKDRNLLDKLIWLKGEAAAQSIKAIVWISAPTWMTTAFSMRIAEVQIWWAMKYHSLSLPDIDMYVSSLSFKRTQQKFGNLWHTGRLQLTRHPQPKSAHEAQRIRANFTGKVILGSLGREEKLNSPTFLAAVARILRENPHALYLWTGRKQLDAIHSFFVSQNVVKQTLYIGWVDIAVYSQVLDIFLDSFPFGCGFTAVESMAAGVSVVLMATPENGSPNLDQLIWPLFSSDEVSAKDRATARNIFINSAGELLYQRALDTNDYINRAQRLISDENYRRQVGASYQAFAQHMMSDPVESAAIYADHFHTALSRSGSGSGSGS